jgi:hypothetical protein
MSWWDFILRLIEGLSGPAPAPTPEPAPIPTDQPDDPLPEAVQPVRPRVFLVVYDPVIPSRGGRRLTEVRGWNAALELANAYIADLKAASHNYVDYNIVGTKVMDSLPVKIDGYQYDPDEYIALLEAGSGFHQPDGVDYDAILADFDIVEKVNNAHIDEIWMFGPPYGGFYESVMAGPGSFWCNAPPLSNVPVNRRFIIMGFSYERGVGEMLESMGHRAESIMEYVHRHIRSDSNLWKKFIRYEKTHPGKAEVGNIHFAPNSRHDYDWGNTDMVLSRCDSWFNFPDLSGEPRQVNSQEWGAGDTRQHHTWWLRHFPHVPGRTGGILNNWWAYVINPNKAE